jgi:hypothetical protein
MAGRGGSFEVAERSRRGHLMSFHTLFGKHAANLKTSRWESGQFVSQCVTCGAAMVKPPGLDWQLQSLSMRA